MNLRRHALLLALLAVGPLAACGLGPAGNQDKIAKTTSTYLRALAHGDTAKACAQLSRHAQGDDCAQAVKQRLSRLTPAALNNAADASINITVHGSTATSRLGKPHGARLTLVKHGSNWRIDSGFSVPAAARSRPAAR
jgi:hypothetical protein